MLPILCLGDSTKTVSLDPIRPNLSKFSEIKMKREIKRHTDGAAIGPYNPRTYLFQPPAPLNSPHRTGSFVLHRSFCFLHYVSCRFDTLAEMDTPASQPADVSSVRTLTVIFPVLSAICPPQMRDYYLVDGDWIAWTAWTTWAAWHR